MTGYAYKVIEIFPRKAAVKKPLGCKLRNLLQRVE
jgi:hypothetical protein